MGSVTAALVRVKDGYLELLCNLEGRFVAVSWPAAYTNSILEWTDSPGVNQLWQMFAGTVCVVDGRNTVTCELTFGARFFRLKSTAGR